MHRMLNLGKGKQRAMNKIRCLKKIKRRISKRVFLMWGKVKKG